MENHKMKEKILELISEYELNRISDFLLDCVKPSVRINLLDKSGEEVEIGISKLGGCPDLPEDITWPIWRDVPLSFIGQFDLSEISTHRLEEPIPTEGMLFFFYDAEQRTWGFDPEDRGSWRVFYSNVEKKDLKRTQFPGELPLASRFQECSIQFVQDLTFPPSQSELVEELHLDDDVFTYIDFRVDARKIANESEKVHRLFGYPDQIQNDMKLECQLVSNGLYCGDGSGYLDSRRSEIEEGANDWKLLLQIDSEQEIGMCWGDVGRLYFWITSSNLKESKFDEVWMILQC